MIVREILILPVNYLEGFDYLHDYSDTVMWLRNRLRNELDVKRRQRIKSILGRLHIGQAKFIKKFLTPAEDTNEN